MKAISYIGAVVGGTPSMLYFDWNGDVSSHTKVPTCKVARELLVARLRFLSLLLSQVTNDLPGWRLTAAAEVVGQEMGALAPS